MYFALERDARLSGRWERILKELLDRSGNSLRATKFLATKRHRKHKKEFLLAFLFGEFCAFLWLNFWWLSGAEPALAECVAHHLDAALEVELLHYVGFVSLYCLNADSEIGCDLFVRVSPGNKSQYFYLTLA